MTYARSISTGQINKLYAEDGAAHDWYRFVLSFPPHLVESYIERFGLTENNRVLDPFCGTGTTLVESRKLGIDGVGIEGNPMAHFASAVKVDWSPDPEKLLEHATRVADNAYTVLQKEGIEDHEHPSLFTPRDLNGSELKTLAQDKLKLLLTNSISPIPLHKTLVLLDAIEASRDDNFYRHERLALAKALVYSISNLHFGPEVGVGKMKPDAVVVGVWLNNVRAIANDLRELKQFSDVESKIHLSDARQPQQVLELESIDAVITSPPYPNEKDYTRTTRLESVLLGFINNKSELQALKRGLMRSNTRNVYKGDEDDQWIAEHNEIQRIAAEIETKRIELGKTSGFEKLYAKVTKLYFGGMARHLADLRKCLRTGAQLAYVVGDQASYFRVLIRTGQLLADIADSLGYEIVAIELFRSRLSTVTGDQLREETVLLRWRGNAGQLRSFSKHHLMKGEQDMPKDRKSKSELNRYGQIIKRVFESHYKKGSTEVKFSRDEFERIADELQINLPKNLGDIVYSYRYRNTLPDDIRQKAPKDKRWIIRPVGRSQYAFALIPDYEIAPSKSFDVIKVPDSTPGLVTKYSLNDEQALLVKLRYNRLLDIFTGVTCYSLQNHLRTTVPGLGQVETDEVYIGVDKQGVHHVFPVQAKGGKDRLDVVQIEQDIALCKSKFETLKCHPIGAQFMADDVIALLEFRLSEEGYVRVAAEKHYKLVPHDQVTPELLEQYKSIAASE
jgi:hypothetical protein